MTILQAIQRASIPATCRCRLRVAGTAFLYASTLGWGHHGSMIFQVLHVRVLALHLTSTAAALPCVLTDRLYVHSACAGPCHAQSGGAAQQGSKRAGLLCRGTMR